ncbi:MAG: polyvinyl alcohol dehydrogenase (cytochrome) [Halieaceae bacterium]|jgi:polyvinyl alcohol dehydrogenase (cytochrome)
MVDTKVVWGVLTLCLAAFWSASLLAAEPTPAALYDQHCASCHEEPASKAPSKATLGQMPLSRILTAMEFGRMAVQASVLSPSQREAVGGYLTAIDNASSSWVDDHSCESKGGSQPLVDGLGNWGLGRGNARYVGSGVAIAPNNVEDLELQWVLAIPGATDMRSQPVASNGVLYLGTQNGNLLALQQESGCVLWRFRAASSIRTALNLERGADGVATIYFADDLGTVYSVEATAGVLRWKRNLKWFPTSIITGSLAWHEGVLFVPISSYEVATAAVPGYPCCRSHGGVIAVDGLTGKTLWEYHSTETARKTTVNRDGVQMWGPSGASVWTTPTIDAKRKVLYIGTGENVSSPATDTSDAIIALDLASGAVRWRFQALAGDAWNSACLFRGANCPAEKGSDFDFGGAVALVTTNSDKDLLLAGQKSGVVYALDPTSEGRIVWQHRLSQGTTNGGIHWGVTSDGERLFVPVSDPDRDTPGYTPNPGVYALDVSSGKLLWEHRVERGCSFDPKQTPPVGLAAMMEPSDSNRSPWPDCSYYYGQSAAAVLANGVVYAGALDGKLRLLSAATGDLLRVFSTNQKYTSLNGVEGHGGAIDLSGVTVSGRRLFVLSGYGMFGQMPGNVLLSYALPKEDSIEQGRQW